MKALVLAAGEGKRLQEGGYKGAKPLYNILGLSLLERTLLSLRKAGIREAVVVLGCYAEEIKKALGDGSHLHMDLTYVVNEEWKLGNGVSVLAAREYLQREESFILVMSDHVLTPEIIEKLVCHKPAHDELYVGADFKLDRVFDLQEATKIEIGEEGKVINIGKNIPVFQAADCGVFHITPFVFAILHNNIKAGHYTWSEAVAVLAKVGKVKAVDIEEGWWIDIDTLDDAKEAERMLLKSLPSSRDGLIARCFNRRISVFITRFLSKTPVKPNQVSFFSFLLCLLAAFLFARGYSLWAGITAQIASVIDGVDGELARLKFLHSGWGEMLDSFLDRYGDGFIIIGMALSCFYTGKDPYTIVCWLGLALIGAPLSMLFKEKFRNVYAEWYLPKKEKWWANLLLGNRDGRLFIIMLTGILNQPLIGIIVLAVTSHLLLFIRMLMVRNMGLQSNKI